MSSIINVQGREILDSRGNPTVEVEVMVSSGVMARAAVPSGASTGVNEALELRDNDPVRYHGKGVLKAVQNINDRIAPLLLDNYVLNQRHIDHKLLELDGTENKSNLGANAILGVSLACAKAAARHLAIPFYRYLSGPIVNSLPVPMANILNGGAHANNSVDVQEFMIIPHGLSNTKNAIRCISEIFYSLKSILIEKNHSTSIGDEGGFAPNLRDNEEAIELILEAIAKSGYQEDSVSIGLDIAASEMLKHSKKSDRYVFWKSSKKSYSSDELIVYWDELVKKYPQIISLEDPLGEEDWTGWKNLTKHFKDKKIKIIGDDLFVTNEKYLTKGIENNVANSILIKLNQIGTLTETLEVIEKAKNNGYTTVISHRSGETEDTCIADLAVGSAAHFIKTGSVCRSERVAKYNQLLRIEEELDSLAIYSKGSSLNKVF